MRKRYCNKNGARGFTLIELVVVIAILGVLATVATISGITITRSVTSRSVKSFLSNTWSVTATYFKELNSGFSAGSTSPSAVALNARFKEGGDGRISAIETKQQSGKLANGKVHVQYKYDATATNKYTIVKICYTHKDVTYYTTNGGKSVYKA